MTILLEVNGLKVLREKRQVLEVEHLSVEEGEVLAVIGPNGAGKSTLLLALSRLLRPAAGEILFRGQRLDDLDELAYRRKIGLVLQEPLLIDASAFDNVALGLRFRGEPAAKIRQRADEWLEKLGVAHLRSRPARKLSGGEAQRVSLARAFALQPELLLLDEPFSALDTPTRRRLLEDFQTLLATTGITTVFITHDLDEALSLGKQAAVLLSGRLRQAGTPQEVFTAPADREVAAFVGVETVISGRVLSCEDGQVTLEVAGGLHLQAVGECQPGRQALLCLRPEDVTLWQDSHTLATSARNRLTGKIQRLTQQGPLVRVVVDCGFPLAALITRASRQDMKLEEGMTVYASFKASAAHLIMK